MSSPISPRLTPSSPRNNAPRRALRRDLPSPAVALTLAAFGDLPALREVLARAPELARATDTAGRTPLHVAAASGHDAIVRELLARGADPHAEDSSGRTPAADAAAAGALNALRALAAADAPLNGRLRPSHVLPDIALARDLAAAAATGDARTARVLVAAFGANVNTSNADHRTPLHLAVEEQHVAVARYLLSAGADPDRPDRRGITAAQAALSSGNQNLINVFAPPFSPSAVPASRKSKNPDFRLRGESLPLITRIKRTTQPVPPIAPVMVAEVHVAPQKKHQTTPYIVRVESPRYGPPTSSPHPEILPCPPPPVQPNVAELKKRQEIEKRQLLERQENERRVMEKQQALQNAEQEANSRRSLPPRLQLVSPVNTVDVQPHTKHFSQPTTPQATFTPPRKLSQQLLSPHLPLPHRENECHTVQARASHDVQSEQPPALHGQTMQDQIEHVPSHVGTRSMNEPSHKNLLRPEDRQNVTQLELAKQREYLQQHLSLRRLQEIEQSQPNLQPREGMHYLQNEAADVQIGRQRPQPVSASVMQQPVGRVANPVALQVPHTVPAAPTSSSPLTVPGTH